MPSHKHHSKEGHKTKELKCKSGHSKCTPGTFESHALRDGHQSIMWEVRWWPCRKDDAIAYMKSKHGYIYHKPKHHKSHDNHQSKQHITQSSSSSSQRVQPGQVASGQQNTPAQAATRRQNQHHQMPPPPTAYPPSAPIPPEMPQQQFTTKLKYMHPTTQGRIGAWMDGRVDYSQDMDSDEDMAPLQCFARAQNMASGPAMPSHDATPDGQHHRRHHHKSSHRPKPELGPHASSIMSPDAPVGLSGPPSVAPDPVISSPQATSVGQQQMINHHNPESGQMPQSYATMPPPEASAPGPALAPAAAMSLHHAPSDGQRHGHRRHHRSSREPRTGPEQDSQPLSNMPLVPSTPAAMVSPAGMAAPPAIPSTQYPPYGRQHQRHRRGASGVSHHEQAPQPLTAQPPPPTMRECMASMAEEAMLSNPTQNIALRPGPPPPPGMAMPPGCPHSSTQNLSLRAEGQAAFRMPDTRDLQFPVGPPQSGTMTIAAADAPMPPNPQSMRRQPRQGQQQSPPGMSLRASVAAASAAGTPGPQAMAVRPAAGAFSGLSAMSSNQRRQPPPTSMPPFPGTGPGSPASMDLAMAPPPKAPTPPSLLGEDD